MAVAIAGVTVVLGLPAVVASPVAAAPLGAPSAVTATNSDGNIEVSWQPTTPDRVVGYEVYRNGIRIGQPVTGATAPMVAVGDIALCNSAAQIAGHTATANLVAGLPGPIALLGDEVQGNGSLNSFVNCYDNQWGRFRNRSFPIPGNHEWNTPNASPFYSYFGNRAGTPGQGWISYTVGDWRVIGLDTNCWEIEGCVPGSAQYEWLAEELAASTSPCTMVYGHQPRWRNTLVNNAVYLKPLWELMYDNGVELYLAGDQHIYARYGVTDPSGNSDANGIRQITVGTGGYSHGGFGSFTKPFPQARDRTTFGVLALDLSPTSYDFEFKPAAGQGTFTDAGSEGCHGPNASRVRFVDRNQSGQANTYQVIAYDAQGNRSVARMVSINGGATVTPPATTAPTPTPASTSTTNRSAAPKTDGVTPRGAITGVGTPGAGRIAVAGWGIDPDADGPTKVTVTVDGTRSRSFTTAIERSSSGRRDGFYIAVAAGQGSHVVCARVENIVGNQPATSIGCRRVQVQSSSPTGTITRMADQFGRKAIVGWAVDADTVAPVRVQISIDDRYVRTGQAGTRTRLHVARYPGYGQRHGFWLWLPTLPGTHKVCLWAEDDAGTQGRSLGCRLF